MSRERFRRVEDLFHQALELPAEQRAHFLDEHCDDSEVRAKVNELLELDAQEHALGGLPGPLPGPSKEHAGGELEPGNRIGPFVLGRRIGEGGMGVVFEAEQLEPMRRRVALKLVKRGMDTDQIVQRFETERQALAMMNHPNIARVYEAGSTDAGRPYFAMEFVEGSPVTRYCDVERLETRARLELFLQICEGVQHAHRKGVVHRDLKPSNLLVSSEDGKPAPKIIDFGIAKALDPTDVATAQRTAAGQLLGTPQYMSPEQATGAMAEVDTRTDVYALGVVLYEMLAGALPFELDETESTGFDEIRRRIREDSPSRPSARVDTLGEDSKEIANRRRTEVSALRRQLRGDLDWIAMKALEKEPARRYQTASEFAADIRRHLNHEPVLAGPPDFSYRARRFVRRNRALVVALSGIGLALIAGIVVSTLFAIGQSRARAEAERQAEVSSAVLGFLQDDVLAAASPEHETKRELTVREALDVASETIDERFVEQPSLAGSIHSAIGLSYSALGEFDRAETHLGNAIERFRIDPGAGHPDYAKALGNLGEMLRRRGRLVDAEPLLVEALEAKRHFMSEEDESLAISINNLGLMYRDLGKMSEAEPLLVEALDLARRYRGEDHIGTLTGIHNLALFYGDQGRRDEAIDLLTRNLESWKRVMGETHAFTLQATQVLAANLREGGRVEDAIPLLESLVPAQREVLGADHPGTLVSTGMLAAALSDQGRTDEAAGYFETAISGARQVMPDHWHLAILLGEQGRFLAKLGRFDDAEAVLVESRDRLASVFGAEDPRTVRVAGSLAEVHETRARSSDTDPADR